MNDISTRDKILEISHRLFADKGLNGVSVREIARLCDVNIAAINYHFKNKENLYLETVKQSVVDTEKEIRTLYNSMPEPSIDEFVIKVYEHFRDNAEDLRTGFKLIISSENFAEAMGSDIEKFNGPPGGEFFAKCIKKELPNVLEEDIQWAVRVLFTQVIHKALMMCNNSICKSLEKNGLTAEHLMQDLIRLTRIVKADLK